MWSLLLSAALAGPPPDGLDVPAALDTWEARSKALLAGPSGCWELSGQVELLASGYVPLTRWTRPDRHDHRFHGDFTGRIEDGTWTAFDYTLVPDDEGTDKTLEIPIFPMLGKYDPKLAPKGADLGPDTETTTEGTTSISIGSNGASVSSEGGTAVNTLHKILDAIDPETATSYAEWDENPDGVKLYEDFPLGRSARADVVTVTTFVPMGGPVATALDLVFPGRVKVGDGLVKATIFDAQGHVRAQVAGSVVLPALESLSLGLGAVGFTVGYEQRIIYREARRCGP